MLCNLRVTSAMRVAYLDSDRMYLNALHPAQNYYYYWYLMRS